MQFHKQIPLLGSVLNVCGFIYYYQRGCFFSRLAVHFVYDANYVTFFDMELEQLLVNDQSTASCQAINRVKPRD